MLISPQAMTFQKINNVTAYPQHKSDKTDHEILQYYLRGGGGEGYNEYNKGLSTEP